jgi:ribulose-5-phosphate 4-epimerase/fuculose-1-phosphate aldolase
MPLGRLAIRSPRDEVPPAEWEARVDLAACYRLVAHYGMVDMIANHISVRVPGHHDQFLINAYGLFYEEITASSLIKIDLDGAVIAKPADLDYSFNRAGFVIHSAIHRARPDIGCVIHTHTAMGMAVSAMKCGLLPMTQTAMRFTSVGYHDYESVAIDLDEQQRLVRDLGDAEVMILRNHGLIACGASIPEAFSNIWRLELACTAQVAAMSTGTELVMPSPAVIERTNHLYKPTTRRPWGVLEWPGLLRMLDRRDPSYRV